MQKIERLLTDLVYEGRLDSEQAIQIHKAVATRSQILRTRMRCLTEEVDEVEFNMYFHLLP